MKKIIDFIIVCMLPVFMGLLIAVSIGMVISKILWG